MTDTELSQLRQQLLEQFSQMQADDVPTSPQDLGDYQSAEWAPKR